MPKLSKTQQDQRRAHILDSAELCFSRAGFHRTTMQDICREAKISAGAVYVYFPSKEALIDGIVERDREELIRNLAEVGQAEDIVQGLEGLLQSSILDRPPHKIGLYMQMLAEAGGNAQVADAMRSCEATLMDALTEMLAEAQRRQQVASSITPQVMARLLLVMGDGMFALLAQKKTTNPVDAVVLHMLAMLSQFLRTGLPVPDGLPTFDPAAAAPAGNPADLVE